MVREEQNPSLCTPLIQDWEENGAGNGKEEISRKSEIIEEAKKLFWLAGPIISVNLLLYLLRMISVMFVGHLGELPLSGASMATSFGSVTGFSFLIGLSAALETLAGQAYGARQYHMLGIHLQRAMIILLLASIPIVVIWANMQPVLVFFGQDFAIAVEAGQYARFMIPSLFAFGLLQCFIRFLQAQSIVFPMMLSCGITTLLHIFICWFLVLKSGLGNKGAAIAISISYWINVVLLGLYVKFSSVCAKTWTGFSKESLHNIPSFLSLAIPSSIMVCLELWSFEMLVLLSGLLPNLELETAVSSIILSTSGIVYMLPLGFSAAVSIRVSNELGAGHPEAAYLAVRVTLVIVLVEGLMLGIMLILIRNIWGYAYSNETEVIKYVAKMLPILAVLNFIDGIQSVLSGNARGCGWQKIGAYVNLGSFYLVGIPLAIVLAFVFNIGGQGLWLGIICALIVQALSLFAITIRTNWEQEANKAAERMCDSKLPINVVS